MTTLTAVQRLTGLALIDHATTYNQDGRPKSDMCKDAGYTKTLDNGTTGTAFVDFYEALIEAKKESNPELFQSESDCPDYDSLPDDTKELYDDLSDGLGRAWTHEDQLDFIQELEDIGIETKDQFDNSFDRYIDGGWNAEAEFSEELVSELEPNLSDSMVSHAIDWQAVWDHQLKYDYNSIHFDGAVYFFRNI